MAMPIFIIRTFFSVEKVGYVLPGYVFGCAVKKSALRFIEDGKDVTVLVNIVVDAESPCFVSIIRGDTC